MWLELMQGPRGRAPRHFTRATRFPTKLDGARWSCAVANWEFGGARVDGQWTLDMPARTFLRNGKRVQPGSALEPLDVLLFDDGLAIRAYAYPVRSEFVLPDRWWALDTAALSVLGDQLLEAGDPLGELLVGAPVLRSKWLAALLLPSSTGDLEATWAGPALETLEVRFTSGVRLDQVEHWLERLPRRLHSVRLGEPLSELRLVASHFATSTWRDALETLSRSVAEHPLPSLLVLDVVGAGHEAPAHRVTRHATWERLVAACPLLERPPTP